jgi:hypothetical protein
MKYPSDTEIGAVMKSRCRSLARMPTFPVVRSNASKPSPRQSCGNSQRISMMFAIRDFMHAS